MTPIESPFDYKKTGWGFWSHWELRSPYTFYIGIMGLLIQTPEVTLTQDGYVHIKKGYVWEASGPTWDTPSCRRGALRHDAGYDLIKHGLNPSYRQIFDLDLRDTCIEDGMSKLRAHAWYKAVRIFGAHAVAGEYEMHI